MNDLKNILNYFGDCWELRRFGNDYRFMYYLGEGKWQTLLANSPDKMSAKIKKIINECAIKKKPAKKKGKK